MAAPLFSFGTTAAAAAAQNNKDTTNQTIEVKEVGTTAFGSSPGLQADTDETKAGKDEAPSIVRASRSNPMSYVFSPMVKIIVGKRKRSAYAHKALLTAYSPYFEACLNLAFVEGQTCEVNLVEEDNVMEDDTEKESVVEDTGDADEEALGSFIQWLYTGYLANEKDKADTDTSCYIYEIYALADRLLIHELKNHFVDGYRRALRAGNSVPWPSSTKYLFGFGLLDSKLGRFLLRQLTYRLCKNPSLWVEDKENTNSMTRNRELRELYDSHEISTELLKCMIQYQNKNWEDPIYAADCDFHEHPDGKICTEQTPHKPK